MLINNSVTKSTGLWTYSFTFWAGHTRPPTLRQSGTIGSVITRAKPVLESDILPTTTQRQWEYLIKWMFEGVKKNIFFTFVSMYINFDKKVWREILFLNNKVE